MTDFLSQLEIWYKKEEISIQEMEFARFLYELDGRDHIPMLIGTSCFLAHLNGHICIDLDYSINHKVYGIFLEGIDKQVIYDSLASSKLVGDGSTLTPLVMDEDRIYLHKFWKFEKELADWLSAKSQKTKILSDEINKYAQSPFNSDKTESEWQKVAVLISLIKNLTIISGGPGTGKTFTIQKIVDALIASNPTGYSIALAAPTGKAAQRLSESLDIKENQSVEAPVTIHKLLGAIGESGEFRYNEKNPLPFNAIIVDEASMLDITLWIRLIRSIPEDSKLIVLGDKNQLASVEAGSILGDVCFYADNHFSDEISSQVQGLSSSGASSSPFNDSIVLLEKNYRFDEESGIQLLAEAINKGAEEEVLILLSSDEYPELMMSEPTNEVIEGLIHNYVSKPFSSPQSGKEKFAAFNEYQILCALRKGPYGVNMLNLKAEKEIKRTHSVPGSKLWFNGRAIMLTRNNSVLKLKNGETGICIETREGPVIEFEGREKPVQVSRLQHYEPAYATTVHKSQGSEYDHVAIVLSNTSNRVLSRQLLYTSVTRARKSVLVIGNTQVISSTVQRGVMRRSGLRKKIWGE